MDIFWNDPIRHLENKNVIKLTLSESEVKAPVK